MTVVLHNIRSAFNVGSIFRTADATGCEKLYLCGVTPDPIDRFGRPNTKVAKVSLGAERSVSWEHRASTARLLDQLKKDGSLLICLEQDKTAVPLKSVRLSKTDWQRAVLVLGDEVKGLSPSIVRRADTVVEIPMRGKKESLNVAVAFGIAAYALNRS